MKHLLILLMLLIAMPSIGQHSTPFTMGGAGDDNGMTGGITEAPIESWVFSNSSTLPTDTYDHVVNVTSGSGELDYANQTTVRSTGSGIRANLTTSGFPISTGTERGVLIDFNVSSSLSGLEVVKATLNLKAADWHSYTGVPAVFDIAGIIHSDLDDWVDYSTSTASDVCYAYYDASTTSSWGTAISTFDDSSPGDGWTDTYPATGAFWAVHSDSSLTSYALGATLTFDVTEAVQAWAAGENEGGFLIHGTRVGGLTVVFDNINQSASGRPFLEVYAR